MIRAATVSFIASFCTLVIELVAGRMLAPHVGVSLYTWTSIIGVVLAGISAGAWAGGRLADRRPRESTLGWLLLASGIAALLIGPATTSLAGEEGLLASWGIATTLLSRVVVLSFLLFFIPSALLGMISPVAVRLAVNDIATTGTVVGKISAFSTLGAIAGTFTTGFFLVARFGTRATVTGVGIVLILTALFIGGLAGRRVRAAAAVLLGVFALVSGFPTRPLPPPPQRSILTVPAVGKIHFEESQYTTIAVERTVREDTGAPIHALHLDHLVHSYTDLADPLYLEYGYLEIFKDVIESRVAKGRPVRMLFIGGGGYTLPRLLDKTVPDAEIDVVEIDPAVTRVAQEWFGIREASRIRTINADARWFALRNQERYVYDFIFLDAFNDLSVPYHLTTLEFTTMLRRLLTPEGVLAVNVIDDYEKGRFLASYVRTLQKVFDYDDVDIVLESRHDKEGDRSTFVVLASESLPRLARWEMLGAYDTLDYVQKRKGIVLTDDYVPVDNMLAPLFRDRFADEAGE